MTFAALIHALIAAAGGILVHDFVTIRALSLLVGLALLFAGVAGLAARKTPRILVSETRGPFLAAFVCFFIAEFGDVYPDATVLLTGVEDPDTRAHGTNESLHLGEFERACLAETLLLAALAR